MIHRPNFSAIKTTAGQPLSCASTAKDTRWTKISHIFLRLDNKSTFTIPTRRNNLNQRPVYHLFSFQPTSTVVKIAAQSHWAKKPTRSIRGASCGFSAGNFHEISKIRGFACFRIANSRDTGSVFLFCQGAGHHVGRPYWVIDQLNEDGNALPCVELFCLPQLRGSLEKFGDGSS